MSESDRSVRPWKAPSNPITAGRPVYARANLTAFSTASVPALKNAAFAGTVNGCEREQPLGKLCVDLVRDDGVVGVSEALQLLLRGRNDPRMGVAHVEAADAAGEVDEDVPVDVGDRRAARLGGDDRERQVERGRHAGAKPVEHLSRARAGNLGDDLGGAGRCHRSEGSESPGRQARLVMQRGISLR